MRRLDVASGTGHLGRAVAPYVRSVAGVDVTTEMLRQARAEAAEARLRNLHLVQAAADRLPFADEHFDLVLCRLALHHFADPAVEVAEMARVTRASGTLAIVDLLSPNDSQLADRQNRFERMRDPSHTRALTVDELRDLLEAVGRPVDCRSLLSAPFEPQVKMSSSSGLAGQNGTTMARAANALVAGGSL